MSLPAPLYQAPPGFDRLAERRRDADWWASLRTAAEALVLPVWHGKHAVAGPREAPMLNAVPAHSVPWDALGARPILLGTDGTALWLAADLGAVDDPTRDDRVRGFGPLVDLRTIGPLLPGDQGALAVLARGLVWFHQRHRFCGVCGGATEMTEAGHARRCRDAACGATVFPRMDPAVIVLVAAGDSILLARSPRFPPGMHSVLAGFVEVGESLEDTVRREIREEAGIEVDDIRYVASQPWPFPQSLMLGFTARAVTTDLQLDPEELEEGAWYRRQDLLAIPADRPVGTGAFALPRRDSIARRLVDGWLAGTLP